MFDAAPFLRTIPSDLPLIIAEATTAVLWNTYARLSKCDLHRPVTGRSPGGKPPAEPTAAAIVLCLSRRGALEGSRYLVCSWLHLSWRKARGMSTKWVLVNDPKCEQLLP